MTPEEKRKHLNGLRAHFDKHLPGWRDESPLGKKPTRIEVEIVMKDGERVKFILHATQEEATEAEGEDEKK